MFIRLKLRHKYRVIVALFMLKKLGNILDVQQLVNQLQYIQWMKLLFNLYKPFSRTANEHKRNVTMYRHPGV